jgi:hypothetical protein
MQTYIRSHNKVDSFFRIRYCISLQKSIKLRRYKSQLKVDILVFSNAVIRRLTVASGIRIA